jgi:hypothetical protein
VTDFMCEIIYACTTCYVTLRVFVLYVAILNLNRSLSSAKSEPLFVFCFNYIIDRFVFTELMDFVCHDMLTSSRAGLTPFDESYHCRWSSTEM